VGFAVANDGLLIDHIDAVFAGRERSGAEQGRLVQVD
jgi:hypothetical protein